MKVAVEHHSGCPVSEGLGISLDGQNRLQGRSFTRRRPGERQMQRGKNRNVPREIMEWEKNWRAPNAEPERTLDMHRSIWP